MLRYTRGLLQPQVATTQHQQQHHQQQAMMGLPLGGGVRSHATADSLLSSEVCRACLHRGYRRDRRQGCSKVTRQSRWRMTDRLRGPLACLTCFPHQAKHLIAPLPSSCAYTTSSSSVPAMSYSRSQPGGSHAATLLPTCATDDHAPLLDVDANLRRIPGEHDGR